MKAVILILGILTLAHSAGAHGPRAPLRQYGPDEIAQGVIAALNDGSDMGPIAPHTCVSAWGYVYPEIIITQQINERIPCARLERLEMRRFLRGQPDYDTSIFGRQARVNGCATLGDLVAFVREKCRR